MPYKLISLVFLLSFLITNKTYSENDFLLPVKKPSIFKQVDNKASSDLKKNLPQPKPKISTQKTNNIVVKESIEKKKISEPVIIAPNKEKNLVKNNFLFPKKNQ